eukprot:75239_1
MYVQLDDISEISNERDRNDSFAIVEHFINRRKKQIKIGLIIGAIIIMSVLIVIIVTLNLKSERNHYVDKSEYCGYKHPQYPYNGGVACSKACLNDDYISVGWDLQARADPSAFSEQFQENYKSAANIMRTKKSSNLKMGRDLDDPIVYDLDGMHMTMDYFCCYSPAEIEIIDSITESFLWPPLELHFEKLICTKNDETDSVELMILLDQPSQEKLLPVVTQFEAEMTKHELVVNVPRSDNIGFHVTLAHVDQTVFPVNSIVDQINEVVQWTGPGTIGFNQSTPICHLREKLPQDHLACL